MKKLTKLLLLGCCLILLSGAIPSSSGAPYIVGKNGVPFATGAPFTVNGEKTVPLLDILVYCNTPEFIHNMAENDYMLSLAANGNINDERHGMLVSMELLMNPRNRQWAIIFNYEKGNFSCIVGGNNIDLYKPKK